MRERRTTDPMATKRESQSMASTAGSATSTSRMIPASAGSVPKQPNNKENRRSLYLPASAAGGNGAPEIYWSEGGTPSGAQADTYTFYRDPTPEPPEDGRTEKRAGAGVRGSEDGDSSNLGDRRIFGIKRNWFWGLVALALIIVIAVGIGVGVGVGLKPPSSAASSAQEEGTPTGSTTTMNQPTSIRSPSPTSSDWGSLSDGSTSSTPTRDSAYPTETSSGSLTCPHSNYTLYAVPGSPVRFLRHCDVDITHEHATDIKSVRTESMAECMRNCAGTYGCQGCGFGPELVNGGSEFWCWLKGDLTGVFKELKGWEFAVMQ